MPQTRDLPIGKTFGRLTILSEAEARIRSNGRPRRMVVCKCTCGSTTTVQYDHIATGHTTSCGCAWKDAITSHGMVHTPEYKSWQMMIDRATNPNNPQAKDYVLRGIGVCDEWRRFEAFYRDMGPRPNGLTLDRIDNDLGYFKDNCRWATRKMQQNNRRCSPAYQRGN